MAVGPDRKPIEVAIGGRAISEGETWFDVGAEDGGRVSVVMPTEVDFTGEPQV